MQGLSEPIANILRPLRIRVTHCSRSWKWSICHVIKDRIPNEHRKDVVYSVMCDECDSTYIGETMRTLDARMKEHRRHTMKGEILKSAVAEHACLLDHAIDWESANVLDYTGDFGQRKITEALRIRRHTGVLMSKDRGWEISETWSASWR